MRKIVFATNNESKAKRFSKGLLENGIEVLSLNDLNIKLDVLENGDTAIENALLKARECYKKTGISCIGMDDSLYLFNVPDEKQPGLFVRRVNGKILDDDEMIEYYVDLVKQYGIDGKLNCKWIYGLAVIDELGNEFTYSFYKDGFYMVDVVSLKKQKGYPLNSISKYEKIDKYFTEVSEEDLQLIEVSEDDVISFITSHV